MGHAALNGVATSTLALIHEQLRAGHDVMLVYPHSSWISAQPIDPRVLILPTSFKARYAEIRRVGLAIRSWNADVIHAHGSKGNKFAAVYRVAARAPTVMTAHARRFQLPWMAAHAVIGPSRQTADYYHRHLLVRRRAMRVVPNLFPTDGIEPVTEAARSSARSALGLDPACFVIGSVGHICVRKNQIAMLRVLKELLAAGTDARLVLAGAPARGSDIMHGFDALLAAPALTGKVLLLGERRDVAQLLPAFDVFLLMSKVEEAPIAPLEAMARAIPVVSVDVGNMAALVPPYLLFAHDDEAGVKGALCALSMDEAARADAGNTARNIVAEQLSPKKILPQIDETYRLAIARARG